MGAGVADNVDRCLGIPRNIGSRVVAFKPPVCCSSLSITQQKTALVGAVSYSVWSLGIRGSGTELPFGLNGTY